MDYEIKTREIVAHVADNCNPETVRAAMRSLAEGMAHVLAMIPDHAIMHSAIDGLAKVMHQDACELHKKLHGDHVDAEAFLRDHFNPEKMHG